MSIRLRWNAIVSFYSICFWARLKRTISFTFTRNLHSSILSKCSYPVLLDCKIDHFRHAKLQPELATIRSRCIATFVRRTLAGLTYTSSSFSSLDRSCAVGGEKTTSLVVFPIAEYAEIVAQWRTTWNVANQCEPLTPVPGNSGSQAVVWWTRADSLKYPTSIAKTKKSSPLFSGYPRKRENWFHQSRREIALVSQQTFRNIIVVRSERL